MTHDVDSRTGLGVVAEAYAARGWRVFPIAPQQKVPLHKGAGGFKEATADVPMIRAWWRETPNANIGLWPGPSGYVVIDVDGPVGNEAAYLLGLLESPTLTCVTARSDGGAHLYFVHPGFTIGDASLAPGLDVRADRGYVLLPPSIHPSGRRYAWHGKERRAIALPDARRAALAALQTRAEADAPAHVPFGDVPGDLAVRIRAYLTRVGPRRVGNRNATAFQVAAWLTHDMALEAWSAWPWLVCWNASNSPPLGQGELRRCLQSAERSGLRAIGSGLERGSTALVQSRDPFARCRLIEEATL